MIDMKVLLKDKKIFVYLYSEEIDIDNIDELNKKIRSIFVKLIKRYHLDFFGLNRVIVYHNRHYGLVLEIDKVYEPYYNKGIIDLKIIVYKNSIMYLEFDDYCFSSKPRKLIYKNNKYYLNIDEISNITKYIEYGRVIIKKNH